MPGTLRQFYVPLFLANGPAVPGASGNVGTEADPKKQFLTLDFDKDVPEYLYYVLGAPGDIDATSDAGRLKIWWQAAGGLTSGSVRWGASVGAITPGANEMLASKVQAAATFQLTATGDQAGELNYSEIILQNADSLVVGDLMVLQLFRDATHANDDLDGDAQLISLLYGYNA